MSTTKKEVKLPHLRLPVQLAQFSDKLISVLYKLSKPSSAQELKQKETGLPDPLTIGRGLSYLEYLGIVRRTGGKGIYELTDDGRKIGIELYQNNKANADDIWRTLLKSHPLYGYIQEYIQKKGGGVRGSSIGLGEYLRDLAGEKWTSTFVKEGGKRLCDIFADKGLLVFNADEDSISIPSKEIALVPPTPPPTVAPTTPSEKIPPTLAPQMPQVAPLGIPFGVSIRLRIEVTKDTSVDLAEKIFDFLLKLSERGIEIKPTVEKT